MRDILTKLLVFLAGVLIVAGIGEVVAKVYYWDRHGEYRNVESLLSSTTNEFAAYLESGKTGCDYVGTLYPHPYLAFVHHDIPPCGISKQVNRTGLLGDDFPIEKNDEAFVILLTGGSVASQLGQLNNPKGPRYLEEALNAKYISPTGKLFRVYNGGDGAWKYPQQMILFMLFAPYLDGVVTLDGFNEHYIFKPGVQKRLEFPASNFEMVNPFYRYGYGVMLAARLINRMRDVVEHVPVARNSHLTFLVYDSVRKSIKEVLQVTSRKRGKRADLTWALPREWSDEKAYAWNIKRYRDYIRMMETVAKRFGVRASFFVQPAPAVGKPLSEEEKKVVGDLSYGPIYERMTMDLLKLRAEEIDIFSLLYLLKDRTETLYSDHAHFLNPTKDSRGYRLMAARMADDIAQSWNLRLQP